METNGTVNRIDQIAARTSARDRIADALAKQLAKSKKDLDHATLVFRSSRADEIKIRRASEVMGAIGASFDVGRVAAAMGAATNRSTEAAYERTRAKQRHSDLVIAERVVASLQVCD